MKKVLSIWPLAGFATISLLGTLLHFLFDWSGRWLPVALVSAVNESVWEHMKLLYVSAVVFLLIEWRCRRRTSRGSRAAPSGVLAGVFTIPLLYYTYTGALGVSADWFNIMIYFVAAAVTAGVWSGRLRCRIPAAVAWCALAVLGLLFVWFTFLPPRIPLFRDPVAGQYGI